MYNGHANEFMNHVLSPHMPFNCNSNFPYYSSNTHQHSSTLLTSDPHDFVVSGFNTPSNKSSPTSIDQLKNNDEYLNKKSIKYLQRPATAKSTEGKFHLETNTSTINTLFKRGNRKKTLSLNPEEREALESLVEDVIIVGLKDAVLDSEDSSDESSDDATGRPDINVFSKEAQNNGLGNSIANGIENTDKDISSEVNNGNRYDIAKGNYRNPLSTSNQKSMSQEAYNRHNGNNLVHNNIINNNAHLISANNAMFNPASNRSNFPNSNNTSLKQRELCFKNFTDLNQNYFSNADKIGSSTTNINNHIEVRASDFNNHNNNNHSNNPLNNHNNSHSNNLLNNSLNNHNISHHNNHINSHHNNSQHNIINNSQHHNHSHNNNHNNSHNNNSHNNNNNSHNNSRQSISNMLSVNIYPAQLKVAIKHMDSLPPRFLRRLQSGQTRIGGSEPTLQSLSELSLNHSAHDFSLSSISPWSNQAVSSAKTSPVVPSSNLGPFSESSSACNSVEKERSKSKQTQLQETKKIIRNLLGDLDQYTDEAINHTGEGGEDEGKKAYNFQQPANYQNFLQPSPTSLSTSGFADSGTLFRMNYNRFNSESQLNSLDLQPTHPHIRASASFLGDQTPSREFNSLDVAQGSVNYLTHNHKPAHYMDTLNIYNPNQLPPLPKRTNLKADAPVFISSQFPAKSEAPPSKLRSSDPEITLLPGVLNANLLRPAANSGKQAAPKSTDNSAYPFKMVPSQFFTPMPPSQPSSSQLPSHYNGFMPLRNYNQPSPYSSTPYSMHFNNYNPPMQQPTSQQNSSCFFGPEFPPNQLTYQPWIPPVASGNLYPNNEGNQWYGPYIPPQYMEQPITGMGDGGEWHVTDGVMSLEGGQQRVTQLMRNGASVMVVLLGASQVDSLSDLQMGMSGMCVVHLDQSHPTNHLTLARLREHQEWNQHKVTEALRNNKSLMVVDQVGSQSSELNEYFCMAKLRGYKVVVIRGERADDMFGNMPIYGNEARDSKETAVAIGAKAEVMEFPAI